MSEKSQSLIGGSEPQDSWSRTEETGSKTKNNETESSGTQSDTDLSSVSNMSTDPEEQEEQVLPDRTEVSPDVIEKEAEEITSVDETESDYERVDMTETPDSEIELGVIQVNYSTRYTADGSERTTLHLFCRIPDSGENSDEAGKEIRVDVYNFKPYFYVPPKDAEQIDVNNDSRFYSISSSDDTFGSYESIRGQDLCKVEAHIPRTVGSVRDEYENYEADILLPDRFLVDKGITSGVRVPDRRESEGVIKVDESEVESADVSVQPRIHNVDIEVEDRNGFPEPEDAEEKVMCITGHDEWGDSEEYVVWYLDSENVEADVPSELSDYEFIDSDAERPQIDIRTFDSEADLLLDYAEYLDETGADLIVGWNVDDFDASYLVNRMEKLDDDPSVTQDLNPDVLSKINEVWSGGWRGPNIKGRVVFDLLEAYKRTQFSELDSYRLEAVGQSELGIGKERFDGDIGDLWEHDPERLIEYNLRDVEICVELNRDQGIIDFWDEVRQFVGCRIQDAPIPGDAVDMYVLHKAHGRFVLPTKGTVESGEEFEGGAVFDPMTGIEEMVTVLDLKSLYPMCMTTINASPETKISDPDLYDGETYTAPNGVEYKKDEDGIIRGMVEELLAERDKKKELRSQYEPGEPMYELYDRQQGSVKVIMNSLFGVSGWDRFRLYDKDNAAAVTATGREVINFTEKTVENMGYEVAYGDTDSVMISLGDLHDKSVEVSNDINTKHPDWTEQEKQELQLALDKSFDIENTINEAYEAFALEEFNAKENNFQIEFEKLYRRFLQAGKKKRYAGHIIWKEGKHVDDIDITGFEYKRSDIAEVTKYSQKKLIEMLVTGEDSENVREYLQNLISDFQDGELEVGEIGIPSGIGQPLNEYDTETAHVRGAKYANLLIGTDFGKASKPKRVYISRVHPDFNQYAEEELELNPQEDPVYGQFKRNPDVFCFIHDDQVPDEFEINTEKMLNKTLQGPLSRILDATDMTWEDVKSGQEQKGLDSFM